MELRARITLDTLRQHKQQGRKFSVLTCYDAPTAGLMEAAGVDALLVGDTAGEVLLGLPTTRQVQPDFMLALTAAVRRGAERTFVMADLPWICRAENHPPTSVQWARRFMDETGADAVKIEVAGEHVRLVEAMAEAGVPTIAHLGLLPQMVDPEQGYRAQGRDADSALRLIDEARRFEAAGAAGLLLEAVAGEVAREIAAHTPLPVIGCVAGPYCDGTVVVLHDMIGWGGGHPPRMVKRYADLAGVMSRAFADYAEDIRTGRFPSELESIRMRPGELDRLLTRTGEA
jgi:3-methyl-2-oxobutanoate hydroxymethyltransferase